MNKSCFIHRPTPAASVACLSLAMLCALTAPAQELGPAPGVPEGFMLIEGDILVRLPKPGTPAPKGVYRETSTYFWPGGVVPYEFDANVSAANRTAAINAMAEWEAVANVDFRARSGDDNYIHVQDSNVNSSQVGRVGGRQDVNISSWGSRFIIAHELGHALGFWHEQSRSDRDTYVRINWGNIEEGKAHNFNTHDEAKHYGPYDFDSVMHYDGKSFSTNGLDTITVLPPNDVLWQAGIGQRDHFSTWDQRIMSYLYPESNWRFCDTTRTGAGSGSFLDPFKYFTDAKASVPNYGHLFLVKPGNYAAVGVHSKPMTLRAPLSGAVLK
ncbi:MAG: M12 family metallopeptidase [Verrucomicrobia bacterium]|nr:M12 family metallopeptidase [Verrucomicrobiota bacterium]